MKVYFDNREHPAIYAVRRCGVNVLLGLSICILMIFERQVLALILALFVLIVMFGGLRTPYLRITFQSFEWSRFFQRKQSLCCDEISYCELHSIEEDWTLDIFLKDPESQSPRRVHWHYFAEQLENLKVALTQLQEDLEIKFIEKQP